MVLGQIQHAQHIQEKMRTETEETFDSGDEAVLDGDGRTEYSIVYIL